MELAWFHVICRNPKSNNFKWWRYAFHIIMNVFTLYVKDIHKYNIPLYMINCVCVCMCFCVGQWAMSNHHYRYRGLVQKRRQIITMKQMIIVLVQGNAWINCWCRLYVEMSVLYEIVQFSLCLHSNCGNNVLIIYRHIWPCKRMKDSRTCIN